MTSPVVLQPSSVRDWFDSREDLRTDFLDRYGWADARLDPVGQDMAFRRYFRLRKNGDSVILMESVPDGNAIATPGHRLGDFLRIGAYLRQNGLHAPAVYEADALEGFALLEDFGDLSFDQAKRAGQDQETLYNLATDVLIHLKSLDPNGVVLPDYRGSLWYNARRRLVDWYMPACTGRVVEDGVAEGYRQVWDRIEQSLPMCPQGFLHFDFHLGNLMKLPGGSGTDQCGLLDFQGAMRGPLPYDLANLAENARVDVPAAIRASLLDRYCADMTKEERALFADWYRVLATQFHCRVIGQFIRLAVRDGRTQYLQYIPQTAHYLREGLRHPVLKPLADWCQRQKLDFTRTAGFDPESIRPLIRDDAI